MAHVITRELSPDPTCDRPRYPHRAPRPRHGGSPRQIRDWLAVALLLAVGVLLPAIIALVLGSLNLPQNDDWAYRRVGLHFLQTGHLVFTGWSSMTLVGQIFWVWPFLKVFGGHGWSYGLSTSVLAALGTVSAYYVARRVLPRGLAFASVALLIAFPGFAQNTSTFMTDVPGFSASLACLALGVAAFYRSGWRHWGLVLASTAVGVFAFSIREFALAAPLAILIAGVLRSPGDRARYAAMAGGTIAVFAVIYVWTSHLPGGTPSTLAFPGLSSLDRTVQAYFTLAFALSPAVAFAVRRRLRFRPLSRAVPTGLVLAIGVAMDVGYHGIFVGNYIVQRGTFGVGFLDGGRPILLPGYLWDLMSGVAILSGALLAWLAVESLHGKRIRNAFRLQSSSASAIVALSVFLTAAMLAGYALLASSFFDRYLWFLAFPLSLVLFQSPRRRRETSEGRPGLWLVTALGGLVVLVSVALLLNTDAYAAARWRAGNLAVAAGVKASQVDAGFEWVGAHSTGFVQPSRNPIVPNYEPWYAQMEPGFRECGVVSAAPLRGLHLVGVVHYRQLGFMGRRSPLYVYTVSKSAC